MSPLCMLMKIGEGSLDDCCRVQCTQHGCLAGAEAGIQLRVQCAASACGSSTGIQISSARRQDRHQLEQRLGRAVQPTLRRRQGARPLFCHLCIRGKLLHLTPSSPSPDYLEQCCCTVNVTEHLSQTILTRGKVPERELLRPIKFHIRGRFKYALGMLCRQQQSAWWSSGWGPLRTQYT